MVNANQSSLDLVHALARAEWGALDGAHNRAARVILETLARMQWSARSDRRGSITTTAQQIANAASYSKRWTSYTLTLLEDYGLIEWHRGTVVEGRPTPSIIRIVKTRIVELIRAARARHDEAERRRQAVTLQRLALLRLRNLRPFKRRRGVHVEVTASLPPLNKGEAGATAPARRPSTLPASKSKKDKEMNLSPNDWLPFLAGECHHSTSGIPTRCNSCRSEAMKQGWEERRRQDEDTRRRLQAQHDEKRRAEEAKADAWLSYMSANYPDASRAEWCRISTSGTDTRAAALLRGEAV